MKKKIRKLLLPGFAALFLVFQSGAGTAAADAVSGSMETHDATTDTLDVSAEDAFDSDEDAGSAKADKGESAVDLILDSEEKKNWRRGKWIDGCYFNKRGQKMASLEEADRAALPVIAGIRQKKILYIGSSRTAQMRREINDPEVLFYGCGGSGFRWFFVQLLTGEKGRVREPAYLVIRAFLTVHPQGCVIIDMGGNDLHNIEAYVGFYRDLLKRYPRATFYFQGILPRETGDPSNIKRRNFNLRMAEEFPRQAINLYDNVYAFPDFETIDGTHYSPLLNRRVYQMTMDAIGRKVNVNVDTGMVLTGENLESAQATDSSGTQKTEKNQDGSDSNSGKNKKKNTKKNTNKNA